MRIATWNVNSLKARLEKVMWWLDRAKPDVLLMQETKLADADAPVEAFKQAGYELVHHGEGRWNGVAIASRCGIGGVITNFGEPLRPARTSEIGDDEPLAEARMVAAECGGVRIICVYAPNGRLVDSPFYEAKLVWFDRLARWINEAVTPDTAAVIGGDFNVAPDDIDVWDPAACHGGTHVSERERQAFGRLASAGFVDAYRLHHPESGRYTWWDYRAGNFHKNVGMRIDHLLVTAPLKDRVVWAEIDREARKGKPVPSDHAPLVIDIDSPGYPFDAGWASADSRIAGRCRGSEHRQQVNQLDYNNLRGSMSEVQTFVDTTGAQWLKIDFLPGVELLPLAQPVPQGSIHLAHLTAGTVIPPHVHPDDEFVYVLSGTIESGLTRCPAGTFWNTPAGTRQGPHVAVTDVQILTIRLGAMGSFEGV